MQGKNNDKQSTYILAALGVIPVIWFGLGIAPSIHNGLPDMLEALNSFMGNPFKITFCEDSLKTVLVLLGIYALCVAIAISNMRNYRKGEENGSAKWGNPQKVNRKYKQKPENNNKILTEEIAMGLNAKKHRRNLNTIVIGGSGAGKTFFYAKPNLMQCNCSFVITDPKGEILSDCGYLLKEEGYKIKVLNLLDMESSDCYNPFMYLDTDNDVQRLVTNLFKSTTPKGSTNSDPFWDSAAQMLLMALMFYLKYEAPEDEQNFSMVMEMLRYGSIDDDDEDDDNTLSPLDILFYELERTQPDHIALKYYNAYHSGSGKTLKSIQITLASRLDKFNLDSMAMLTNYDELCFEELGTEKVALFAVIPDNDSSFNFLVSILYTQIFQQLYYLSYYHYNRKALPVSVHFLMDEFANVALPDDFDKVLSTMRSRGVFVSIIIQNLAQVKALFEKEWESIVGNCDETLYLGGNEQSTHKYISEELGKATIDTNTYGRSFGRNGNYSTNYQIAGRELMMPDEVRMLDNEYCILFIRGERPIIDKKYNIFAHPNFKRTEDGGYPAYEHNKVSDKATGISVLRIPSTEVADMNVPKTSYELYAEFELQEQYKI